MSSHVARVVRQSAGGIAILLLVGVVSVPAIASSSRVAPLATASPSPVIEAAVGLDRMPSASTNAPAPARPSEPRSLRRAVRFPSKATPTLAAAVRQVRNNGTIMIRSRVATESITIVGKAVRLAADVKPGQPRPILRARGTRKPVITLGKGAALTITGIDIVGGKIGIAGPATLHSPAAKSLTLKNVAIRDSAHHGIFGRFGSLVADDLSISGAKRYGIVTFGSKLVQVLHGEIRNCGGYGIAIFNNVQSALYVISNESIHDNAGGGVAVLGHAGGAIIQQSSIRSNFRSNVWLYDADYTIIKDNVLSEALPQQGTNLFGDGISDLLGDHVRITANTISSNKRAGIANLGGLDVGYGDNVFTANAFPIAEDVWQGVAPSVTDLAGNSCPDEVISNSCPVFNASDDLPVPNEPIETPDP